MERHTSHTDIRSLTAVWWWNNTACSFCDAACPTIMWSNLSNLLLLSTGRGFRLFGADPCTVNVSITSKKSRNGSLVSLMAWRSLQAFTALILRDLEYRGNHHFFILQTVLKIQQINQIDQICLLKDKIRQKYFALKIFIWARIKNEKK